MWWKQCVRSQDVVGGRRDRGLLWCGQCIRSHDVVVRRRDRGQYGGRSVSGTRMWLEVGEIEDCMVGAMYQEP